MTQGPLVCVQEPSLSGHQVFQKMRVDVNGTRTLNEAASYAEQAHSELAAAEAAVRKYQTHLAEGASGGSWDKAHQAASPLLERVQESQKRVQDYGRNCAEQASGFNNHAEPLHDIPPDAPDTGFWAHAKTGWGLWGTDPVAAKATYEQKAIENKQHYTRYGDQSASNGMVLPNPDGRTLNTTPNVRVYDPHRVPAHGYAGGAPNVGGAGGGTAAAGYAGGGAAAPSGGGVAPPPEFGGTRGAGVAPAAAGSGYTGGSGHVPYSPGAVPDVPAASTNAAAYGGPGGYGGAPGATGAAGSGPEYGRGGGWRGSGLSADPFENGAIPYGSEGDYRWGGSALGGGERPGGRFRASRCRGRGSGYAGGRGGYSESGYAGGEYGRGGYAEGGYAGGRGGYAEGGYAGGEYGRGRYAEGGYAAGESGRGSSGGGYGQAGPHGEGARAGVGRSADRRPFGDPALPPEERYAGGGAARGGGMAPMMGGAGAGGSRDGEHKSPAYLRGNHLDGGQPELNSEGNIILPADGRLDLWLQANGYYDDRY